MLTRIHVLHIKNLGKYYISGFIKGVRELWKYPSNLCGFLFKNSLKVVLTLGYIVGW